MVPHPAQGMSALSIAMVVPRKCVLSLQRENPEWSGGYECRHCRTSFPGWKEFRAHQIAALDTLVTLARADGRVQAISDVENDARAYCGYRWVNGVEGAVHLHRCGDATGGAHTHACASCDDYAPAN